MGFFVRGNKTVTEQSNPYSLSTNAVADANGIKTHHGRLAMDDVAGLGAKEMASATDAVKFIGVFNGNNPEYPNISNLVNSGVAIPSMVTNDGEFMFATTAAESYTRQTEFMMGADAATLAKALVPIAPTVTHPTTAGATIPPGAYISALTWYGDGWESSIGASAAAVTVVAGDDLVVTIPAFPAAFTGGTAPLRGAKVYITVAGGTKLYYAGDIDTSAGSKTFHLAADLSTPQGMALLPPQSHGLAVATINPAPVTSFPITGGGSVNVILKPTKGGFN